MIIVKKDSFYYENDYSPDHEDYVCEKVASIVPFLNHGIRIEEDVTLEDLFSLLEPDAEILQIVFSSHLGHHKIQPYFDEIKKRCLPENMSDMDCIELSWIVEQFNYAKFYEKSKKDWKDIHVPTEEDKITSLTVAIDVHGYGDDDENPERKVSYGIEFTPLYKLKHLPIRLDREFVLLGPNELGGEIKPVAEGVMDFEVFGVIGEILSEVSFCGTPEQRDKEWDQITETVEESKKLLEEENDEDE